MWARKKAFDIRAQIASDARVTDADKGKPEPILQPGARIISVMGTQMQDNIPEKENQM